MEQEVSGNQDQVRSLPRASSSPRFQTNLLILHSPGHQDISDWVSVREKINARAPEIDVRIASNVKADPEIDRWQITRPSLVFTPLRLHAYVPRRGTVYAGKWMGKMAEARRMRKHGINAPYTEILTGEPLDADFWGEYVVVKPVFGSGGRGVRLLRADEAADRFPSVTDNGQIRHVVQPYINHVDAAGRLFVHRVSTLFGEPLYATERTCRDPRPPLAELAADPNGKIASNWPGNPKTAKLDYRADVLAFSRRVASAFPRVPYLAQDIVEQAETGALWVLETNPIGYSWHLSSNRSRRPGYDKVFAQAKYDQFGALDIVADKLIERTRAEAS